MNQTHPNRDLINERASRGCLGRRRRNPARIATEEVKLLPAASAQAAERVSSPPRVPGPLRRWSVAELIARATFPAPAERQPMTGVSEPT
jgi:hypothetical protein